MKYVITGSLGNISKSIVQQLLKEKQDVIVISSKEETKNQIEALGAIAAIGSLEDASFVSNTFKGADAVYLMIPPNWGVQNWLAYQQNIADIYVQAIKENSIKNIVQLSSIGAHMRNGAGPIDGLAYLEQQLEKITDANVLMLRPSYFMYNLLNQVDMLKNAGFLGSNFGGEEKLVLVDTADIAAEAANALLQLSFKGHVIKYISGDEQLTEDIAKTLGEAVDKPNTPWIVFTDEQNLQGMLDAGLPPTIAEGYTQLGKSIRNGELQADYWRQKSAVNGKIKLKDFANVFAAVYKK